MSGDEADWPWNVLGLAEGASPTEVRRAYARRLKALDIERQPEAFAALRQAYEFARMIADDDREADAPAPQPLEDAEDAAAALSTDPAPSAGPDLRTDPDASAPPADAAEQVAADAVGAPPPVRNDPPNAPMASGQPGGAPWGMPAAPPELTFQQVVQRMGRMIADRRVVIQDWHDLLNQPALDTPMASTRFEDALLSALSENWSPATGEVKAAVFRDRDWLELIEDRFAWKADGLRLQSVFPEYVRVRSAYVRARCALGMDAAPVVPKQRMRASHGLSPVVVALVAIPVVFIAFGDARRSEFGAMGLLAGFLVLLAGLWNGLPARLTARSLPVPARFRHGALGGWLARRSAAAAGFNGLILVAVLVFTVFVARPNLIAGWISGLDVLIMTREMEPEEQSIDDRLTIAPEYRAVAKAARLVASGQLSGAAALSDLEMAYPRIRLEAADVQDEVEGGWRDAGAVACARSGQCKLRLQLAVPIKAELHEPASGKTEGHTYPRVWVSGIWGGGSEPLLDISPAVVTARLSDRAFAAVAPSSAGSAGDWRWSVEVAGMDINTPVNRPDPELRVTPPSRADGALIVTSCTEGLISFSWEDFVALNPRAKDLIAEICSIPPQVATLSLQPLGRAEAGPDGSVIVPLSRPFERLLLGLRPGADRASAGAEMAGLANQVSDQIIRDYLTIFWSSSVPEDLAAYLSRRPEAAGPSHQPTEAELLAAAVRQPHLTHAYRFREELGTVLLEDMFRYLTRQGLVQAEPAAVIGNPGRT